MTAGGSPGLPDVNHSTGQRPQRPKNRPAGPSRTTQNRAGRRRPERVLLAPRTPVELIAAIVDCDDRTRRATKIIITLVLSIAAVLLATVVISATVGANPVSSGWALPFGLAGLVTVRSRTRQARCGDRLMRRHHDVGRSSPRQRVPQDGEDH